MPNTNGATDRERAAALFDRALQQETNGQWSEACATYEDILAIYPRHTIVLGKLAHCYEKDGHPKEAIAIYRRILEVDKDSSAAVQAHERLPALLVPRLDDSQRQQYEAASGALEAARELSPSASTDDILRKAGESLRAIVEKVPGYLPAHRDLGDVSVLLGLPTEAARRYTRYLTGWTEFKYVPDDSRLVMQRRMVAEGHAERAKQSARDADEAIREAELTRATELLEDAQRSARGENQVQERLQWVEDIKSRWGRLADRHWDLTQRLPMFTSLALHERSIEKEVEALLQALPVLKELYDLGGSAPRRKLTEIAQDLARIDLLIADVAWATVLGVPLVFDAQVEGLRWNGNVTTEEDVTFRHYRGGVDHTATVEEVKKHRLGDLGFDEKWEIDTYDPPRIETANGPSEVISHRKLDSTTIQVKYRVSGKGAEGTIGFNINWGKGRGWLGWAITAHVKKQVERAGAPHGGHVQWSDIDGVGQLEYQHKVEFDAKPAWTYAASVTVSGGFRGKRTVLLDQNDSTAGGIWSGVIGSTLLLRPRALSELTNRSAPAVPEQPSPSREDLLEALRELERQITTPTRDR